MHIVETRTPISTVQNIKLFYIDCSSECEALDLLERKAFVTQFEKQFNEALIAVTGEDLCHGFCIWSKGWTSNFGLKKHHDVFFRNVFEKIQSDFSFTPPIVNKICASCMENYCGNCSQGNGNKIAY
ncbi:hypothetical protein [Pantoea ananatis]|uniref:hypothetical protein n=1 Tax=Pantoea ananas TaxID=553 RepID=UPI000B7D8C6B|nr:hypothetical protein [Pantoea ananatis]